MNISISNLPFLGCGIRAMKGFPPEYGIEVFIEYGNDYYWNSVLKEILKDRTGEFSIHGPFVGIDLSDENCGWEEVKDTYAKAIQYCKQYKSRYLVCHPFGEISSIGDLRRRQDIALKRALELNRMARGAGVTLLVENMPNPVTVFDEKEFLEILKPMEELNFLIDVGHAMLKGWNIPKMMRELGSRIKGYHIHENHLRLDEHLKVGETGYDWTSFFQAYQSCTPEANLVLEYMNGSVEEIIKNVEEIKSIIESV